MSVSSQWLWVVLMLSFFNLRVASRQLRFSALTFSTNMTKRSRDISTDQSSSKRSRTSSSPPTSISPTENQQTILTSTGSTATALIKLIAFIDDVLSRPGIPPPFKFLLIQTKFRSSTLKLLKAYCSHKRIAKGHNDVFANLAILCSTNVAVDAGLMTAGEAIAYVSRGSPLTVSRSVCHVLRTDVRTPECLRV